MKQIKQISCLLSLAWQSGGAQALRVLNQCNQLNLLTKKDIQLIMLVEQHPSKLVLHSLAGALTKKRFSRALIISVFPCVMKKSYPDF